MQFLTALEVCFIWPERKIKAHLFDPISSCSVQFWHHDQDRKYCFKVVPTLILVGWHQNTV